MRSQSVPAPHGLGTADGPAPDPVAICDPPGAGLVARRPPAVLKGGLERIASNDPRSGRLLPIGCTGWLINDCQTCALTAGHCTGNISVLQFNVPLSNPNGSLNQPPASDQYAVDAASVISNGGQGVGNDWAYFGTFPNSVTGLTAAQAAGGTFTLAAPPGSTAGNDIRITGFGSDNGTANQTQQTHVGPLVVLNGNQVGYVTDTTGGNSGSPVIHEQTGNAIGIHTHGGCGAGGGNNNGTQSTHPALQNALANPAGICAAGGIATVGTIPTLIMPGAATTLQVEATGTSVPGTQMLHYRANPGDLFTSIAMTEVSVDMFEVDLPAFACGDAPDFYLSAQDASCGLVTIPTNAPANFFSAEIGVENLTFADNFQQDLGWSTANQGATTGDWVRGVPVNDPNWAFDPMSDSDGSGSCYLTENVFGNSDVDNGTVRLISPTVDLSSGTLGVFYDYYANLSNDDGNDRLVVAMREAVGSGWVDVRVHDESNGLDWTTEFISSADILASGLNLTATMQVRFSGNDGGTQSFAEYGLDAFKVGEILCSGSTIGSAYCSPAVVNSTGQPGTLTASGSDQVADNNVSLLASSLPANQFGFFITSMTQAFNPNAGGSQGTLCLGGDIGRYNMPVLSTGPGGEMVQAIDLNSVPLPLGTTVVVAGQTWNFQAWHRDQNPGSTSNFTSAVSIDFQ